MRLHRLSVQAFGPFADRVEVDVDALSEQGLFLLHGQTGSGKTSLLDAVCFALYGDVPGDRSTSKHFRSDHAALDTPPEVVCELSVGARRFEVTRSPAWQRPKKKGTGTTTQQAVVVVRELVGGQWVPRADRLDEAGLLLSSVLGMGMNQFTKVVLLPQGDFAAFLRAGADDRKRLLEKLFGTETYSFVEEWLADQRRDAAMDVSGAREATERLGARVEQASASLPSLARALAVDDEPHDEDGVETDDLLTLAARTDPDPAESTTLDVAEARLLRAEHLHERARRGASRARERLARQRELTADEQARHDRWTRYADARREQRELARLEPEVADERRRLEHARAAAGLRGHLDQLAAAESARSVALADVTDAAQPVTELDLPDLPTGVRPGVESGSGEPTVAALRGGVSDRREELGRLAELMGLEGDLATRVSERDAVLDVVQGIEGQLAALDRDTAEREARRQRLTARRDLARPAAAAAAATEDLERARAVARAADESARLSSELRAAETAHLDLQGTSLGLREAHLDLVRRRLDGMAAELASQLDEGAPCPVCGGTEHPSPARAGAAVGAHDVEAAEALAAEAQVATDESSQRVSELTASLAAAEAASTGLSPVDAAAEVERLEQIVRKAAVAAAALRKVEVDLTALEPLDRQAAGRRTELETGRNEGRERLGRLATQVTDLGQRLADARGDDPSVRHRHQRLVGEIEALEHLTAALAILGPTQSALRVARTRAREAATSAGFADLDDARLAALAPDAVHRLENEVLAHEQAKAAVASRLAEPDLVQVAAELARQEGGEPDSVDIVASAQRLHPARAAEADAERTLEAATASVTTAAAAVRDLTGLVARVRDQQKATEPLLERYAVVDDLAGCVLGTGDGNAKRMRLSAYVLAARLEQVADAATHRLTAMSDGRYALQHSDERGPRGVRSGLGLQIVDHWTQQVRETGSLSGGETFLASLALALGLADVVQAESGGLSIETLFVDEGFGTLDDETLDQVMTVLDGLRENGRAVGLVSHVTELRQRIPAQLHVVKTPTGSSVRQGQSA